MSGQAFDGHFDGTLNFCAEGLIRLVDDGDDVAHSNDSITRRGLLCRAVGAGALGLALDSADHLAAQIPDAPGASQPVFNEANWRSLDLPHDWSIEGPFVQTESSAGPGGYAPTGIGWYRKRFRLPAAYQGRHVSIELDGVYQNSEVWINGQYLGKRPFGYISFAYDLTRYLNANSENLISVKGGQLAATQLAPVFGVGHLPSHLAAGDPSDPRGAMGNIRDDAKSGERRSHRQGRNAGTQRECSGYGMHANGVPPGPEGRSDAKRGCLPGDRRPR